MFYVIDSLNAVADETTPAKPFKGTPPSLTPNAIVGDPPVARCYGADQAGGGGPGPAASHRRAQLHLKEIDAALSRHDFPITDRFRLKEAMSHNRILGK
jgi:hypothetical protein